MKKILITLCLILIIGIGASYAQFPPDSDGFDDDPDAPINSGIALLMAAGAGYGIKKLYKKKQ
jgi:hypothetical protein